MPGHERKKTSFEPAWTSSYQMRPGTAFNMQEYTPAVNKAAPLNARAEVGKPACTVPRRVVMAAETLSQLWCFWGNRGSAMLRDSALSTDKPSIRCQVVLLAVLNANDMAYLDSHVLGNSQVM